MNPTTRTVEPYERESLWRTEYMPTATANTVPWELNPAPRGEFGNQQDLQTTRRWKKPAWLSAVVAGIAILRLIGHLSGAGSSSDAGPGALAAGWGVHVCADTNYSSSNVQCTVDDSFIDLGLGLGTPHLSFSGLNGANFSGAPIIFTITRGAYSPHVAHGTAALDGSKTDNVGSDPLDLLLLSAGMGPNLTGDYEIDAHEGATDLGSVSFRVDDYS
jgi:hypothetical protein